MIRLFEKKIPTPQLDHFPRSRLEMGSGLLPLGFLLLCGKRRGDRLYPRGAGRGRTRTVWAPSSTLGSLETHACCFNWKALSWNTPGPDLWFNHFCYIRDTFTCVTRHWFPLKYPVSAIPSIFLSQYLELWEMFFFFLFPDSIFYHVILCHFEIIFSNRLYPGQKGNFS